jgi:hypothetical protein
MALFLTLTLHIVQVTAQEEPYTPVIDPAILSRE